MPAQPTQSSVPQGEKHQQQCGDFVVDGWRSYRVDDVATDLAYKKGFDSEVAYWPCASVNLRWRGRGILSSERNWKRIGSQFSPLLNDGRRASFAWLSDFPEQIRLERHDSYTAKFCFTPYGHNDVEIEHLACSAARY